MIYRISHIIVLLIFSSFIYGQNQDAINTSEISISFDEQKIKEQQVIFEKEDLGFVNTVIDSSLHYKYSLLSPPVQNWNYTFKHLKNIGFGNPFTPTPKDINYEYNTPLVFDGFDIVNNANYAFSKIGIKNNLLSNSVSTTFQDSKGQMWIGYSDGGYSCLKNNEIIHYTNFSNLNEPIVTVFVEFQGQIIIGTKGQGLIIQENKKITNYSISNQFVSNYITDITIDLNDNIWISTENNGLIRLQNGNFFHYQNIYKEISKSIPHIKYNNLNGDVWFYDMNNNLLRLDNSYNLSILNFTDSIPIFDIKNIDLSYEPTIIFGNKVGFFDNEKLRINSIRNNNNTTFNSVLSTEGKHCWMGNNQGELILQNRGEQYVFGNSKGLIANNITHIFEDNFGLVWICTNGNGIYQLSISKFNTLINIHNDESIISSTILKSYNDSLFFTARNGVSVLNSENILVKYTHKQLSQINDILISERGIYCSSPNGLYQIKNEHLYLYKHPLSSQSKKNSHLSLTKGINEDEIYISSLYSSLFKLKSDVNIWINQEIDSLPEISNTYLDSKERIWLSNKKGVLTYLYKGKQFKSSFKLYGINQILEGPNHKIWIASKNGIYIVSADLKSINHLHVKNSSLSNNCQSIFFENDKILWIGTLKNLVKYNIEEDKYWIETSKKGINGSSFIKRSVISIWGSMFWATNEGIIECYTQSDIEPNDKPTVNISAIDLFLNTSNLDSLKEEGVLFYTTIKDGIPQELEIYESDFNGISISLSTNHWGKNANVFYLYKRHNSDEWKGPFTSENIIIDHLPVGAYQFDFKVESINGIDSDICTFSITITEPFYKTFWFVGLILLAIVLILIYVLISKTSFDFKNIQAYSNYNANVKNFRFLVIIGLLIIPAVEYIAGELLQLIPTFWIGPIIFVTIDILFLIISYKDKVSSNLLQNLAAANILLIVLIFFYRCYVSDYNVFLTLELILFIAFSIIILEGFKRFLLNFAVIISVFILSIHDIDLTHMNDAVYVIGITMIILLNVLFQLFDINKNTILNFSEKILNNYDKLVLVYNKKGEVVYTNNELNVFFNCSEKDMLGDKWYAIRNVSIEKKNKIKRNIKADINKNEHVKDIEEDIFSPKFSHERSINWEFLVFDNNYLMATGSDITSLKTQQEEILKLSQIAQKVTNGIIRSDVYGNIIWANQSYLDITQYTLEEIIGKKPHAVCETPDFFMKDLEELKKHSIEGVPFNVAHYNKSGELFWIMVTTTHVYDENGELTEIIEIVSDITEQKKKDIEFERVSLIAEHTQNPILLISTDFEIDWYNGAFVKEFGFTYDSIKGRKVGEIFLGKKSDIDLLKQIEVDLVSGKKVNTELLVYNNFNEPTWVQVTYDPIFGYNGAITEYICVVQNLQEIKEIQQLLEEKNKDKPSETFYLLPT